MQKKQLDATKIGVKIKRLRQHRGYSIRNFAYIINIRPSSILNWEKGKSLPNLEHAIDLCNLFSIRIDEIILYQD
jgi:DNA-binding XRE family transcriptional regulator